MTTFSNLTANGVPTLARSYATASVTPTANRLVLVAVIAFRETVALQPPQPTVTGNGITYDLVRAQDVQSTGADRSTMWVFRGMSAAPTAGAITINFGVAPVLIRACAWSVSESSVDVVTSGTNGVGAIVGSNSASNASVTNTQSASFSPAMTAGNAGYCAVGIMAALPQTPRAGWTELADVTGASAASLEAQYIAGTDTAGSSTWATTTVAGAIVVEVTPTVAPSTAPNAGPDQGPVPSLVPVNLSGAASTGSPTAYEWRIISGGGTLSSTSIVNPTYKPPATVAGGTAVIGLKVGAPTIGTAEDTMTVTYRPHRKWGITATGPVPYLARVLP